MFDEPVGYVWKAGAGDHDGHNQERSEPAETIDHAGMVAGGDRVGAGGGGEAKKRTGRSRGTGRIRFSSIRPLWDRIRC